MKVLLFHPSAGVFGDMIMASLLDLGADLQAVRQAVESVGCRLEISRQERSCIMARRAAVTSDRCFQSSKRCANKKALKNAVRALQRYYAQHADETIINLRDLHDALDECFHQQGGLKYLYTLFPGGPIAQSCRIAGLKAPYIASDPHFGSVA